MVAMQLETLWMELKDGKLRDAEHCYEVLYTARTVNVSICKLACSVYRDYPHLTVVFDVVPSRILIL